MNQLLGNFKECSKGLSGIHNLASTATLNITLNQTPGGHNGRAILKPLYLVLIPLHHPWWGLWHTGSDRQNRLKALQKGCFHAFSKKTVDPNNPSATLSQQSVGVKAILVLLKVVRSNISILPVLDCVVHLSGFCAGGLQYTPIQPIHIYIYTHHCQKINHIFLIGDVKRKEFDKAVIIKQPAQSCRQLGMLFSPPST